MLRFNKNKLKDQEFIMTFEKARDVFGLYEDGQELLFEMDMRALISHGFVECIDKEKKIYKFSDKWKTWDPKKGCYTDVASS